jgi:microcystin-dependent protein
VSGKLAVRAGNITSSELASNSVVTTKIADSNVITAKIANSAITTAKLASEIVNNLVPSGAVMVFAMNSAPSGWLAANGDTIPNGSGTVQGKTENFAVLYSLIGTTYGSAGKLPDLRGYFVRGSGTNGDGTASGGFGGKQADSFANHNHTINAGQQNGISNGCGFDNTFQKANDYDCGLGVTGSSGGTETRPKNIAMLYCIKI